MKHYNVRILSEHGVFIQDERRADGYRFNKVDTGTQVEFWVDNPQNRFGTTVAEYRIAPNHSIVIVPIQ